MEKSFETMIIVVGSSGLVNSLVNQAAKLPFRYFVNFLFTVADMSWLFGVMEIGEIPLIDQTDSIFTN